MVSDGRWKMDATKRKFNLPILFLISIEFVTKATKLARERKVGHQFEADVLQGPQIDEVSQVKILAYIESAKQEGAKLETGGKRWGKQGYFVEPTVFSNVTDNMKIAREEVSHHPSQI